MHGTSQEKICILPMATDKEDEENTTPDFEVPGGTQQDGELGVTSSQDVPERVEESRQPLWRSSRVCKKNSKYANLALVQDIGTELRKRSKNKI